MKNYSYANERINNEKFYVISEVRYQKDLQF